MILSHLQSAYFLYAHHLLPCRCFPENQAYITWWYETVDRMKLQRYSVTMLIALTIVLHLGGHWCAEATGDGGAEATRDGCAGATGDGCAGATSDGCTEAQGTPAMVAQGTPAMVVQGQMVSRPPAMVAQTWKRWWFSRSYSRWRPWRCVQRGGETCDGGLWGWTYWGERSI
jgi:hypothetical protein